jgi:hypothetical protein
MARQLEEMGEKAPVVAVIEGFAPLPKVEQKPWWDLQSIKGFFQNLPHWLADFLELDWPEMFIRISRKLSKGWVNFAIKMKLPIRVDLENIIEDVSGIPLKLQKLMKTHDQALTRFRPPAFNGKVALFRVRGQSLFGIHDQDNGWGKLAKGGVEVRMVTGAHRNLLEKPHVDLLAKELKNVLEEAYETYGNQREQRDA